MYLAALLLSPLLIALAFFAKKYSPLARKIKLRWIELTYVVVAFLVYFSQLIITSIMGEAWRNMLTDLCPNSSMFLALALLFNKKQLVKAVAPWALVGALVTFLAEIDDWDLHFGDQREGLLNVISFFRHIALFGMSLIVLFTYGKYTKKDYLFVFLYFLLIAVWVIIFAGIPYWVTHDPKWGVLSTGFLKPAVDGYQLPPDNIHHLTTDVSGYSILKEIGMPVPAARAVFYVLSMSLVFLFAFLSQFANKHWEAIKPVNKPQTNQ